MASISTYLNLFRNPEEIFHIYNSGFGTEISGGSR